MPEEDTTTSAHNTGETAAADRWFQPGFRFRIVHLLYAMALLSSAMATFGPYGLIPGCLFLVGWTYVFLRTSRAWGLFEACCIFLWLSCFVSLLMLPVVQSAREASRRITCANQLKQIGLALHNYHDVYGSFPPAYVADENGKPMHSWRVLILPYMEHKPLYDQYRFDEPWDGPNNRTLMKYSPYGYRCPSRNDFSSPQHTAYMSIVGPEAAWPKSGCRKLEDFADGSSQTILVIEADPHEVHWMEPRDLTYDEAIALLSSQTSVRKSGHRREDFFYQYAPGRQTVFADGSVHFFYDGLSRDVAIALLSINDGMDLTDVDYDPPRETRRRLHLANCLRLGVFILLTLWPLPWVWIRPYGRS